MPTRIFVDRNAIAKNATTGSTKPVYTVQHPDGSFESCFGVRIDGPSELIYGPAMPTNGARCWVETNSPITILTEND